MRAVGEEALALIGEWHDRLSTFDPGSLVSKINREGASLPVPVDDELFGLLAMCERIRVDSEGAFDVSVGSLMRAHGFRPGGTGEPTSERGVRGLTLGLSAQSVELRGGAEIDLGAIAKGAALDAAREILLDAGVESALIHGGGSTIVAIGAPPGADAWRVRLGDEPGAPSVRLRDQSVSYSSARPGGIEHVMDPRSGRPTRACEASACVGESALETDAWATVLFVRGERPMRMSERLTSAVRIDGVWALAGAACGRIELCTKETCP